MNLAAHGDARTTIHRGDQDELVSVPGGRTS
jgi:hypothetical protein